MHKTQHYKLTLSKAFSTVQQSRYYKLISHFDITKSIKLRSDITKSYVQHQYIDIFIYAQT